MSAERLTPNFVLLWQSDDAPFIHPVIPTSRSGGLRIQGEERAWAMVGLYHDEDEAFTAAERWQPGLRGSGQLVVAQLSDLSYGDYDASGLRVAALPPTQRPAGER